MLYTFGFIDWILSFALNYGRDFLNDEDCSFKYKGRLEWCKLWRKKQFERRKQLSEWRKELSEGRKELSEWRKELTEGRKELSEWRKELSEWRKALKEQFLCGSWDFVFYFE